MKKLGGFNALGEDSGLGQFGGPFGFNLQNEIFDPSSIELFEYMTVQPSNLVKSYINEAIVGLKSTLSNDGLTSNWGNISLLRMYTSHDQQAARLNWVNPSFPECTEVGSPSFTQYYGYTFNGSSSYLNQNWNASGNGGGLYQQNNSSLCIYILSELATSTVVFGERDDSFNGSFLVVRNASNQKRFALNSAFSGATINNISLGSHFLNRINSTDIVSGFNGVNQATVSLSSMSLTNRNHFTGCVNQSGSPTAFCPYPVSFEYKGSGRINHLAVWNTLSSFVSKMRSI